MRGIGLLIVILGLAGCVQQQATPSETPSLRRQLAGAATIVSYDPDRAMPKLGGGFFLQTDEVVTARHVLSGADRADVRTTTGQVIPIAGILAENPAMDLVLVKLQRPAQDVTPLPLATRRSEVGDRLIACGSPLGLEWSVSDGIVSAIRDIPEAGMAMQHSVQVSAGSSGGPLLNMRGEVAAIQTSCITMGNDRIVQAGQSLNFGVMAEHIAALRPGALKPLSVARQEIAGGFVPAVTKNIDRVSLRSLTRDDFRGALSFFEQQAQQMPQEADAWFRLGLCREKLGQDAEAVEAYAKAVAIEPDHATAWNNLGATYIRMGKYPDAMEALTQAIHVRPEYVTALHSLAVSYVKLQRYSEAIPVAVEAVRLDSRHVGANYELGVAYAYAGDREKAMEQHKRLVELDRGRAGELKTVIDKQTKKAATRATTRGVED